MKKKLTNTIEMLLGKGEDTVDVTDQVRVAEALEAEADKLEASFDETTKRLAEFKLTPRATKLLEAACENVSSNMGSNNMEPSAQKQIQERAALFAACDNDLGEVVDTLYGATARDDQASIKEAGSVIYSTCFAVQKAANFVANLWYRRALDPLENEDLAQGGTVVRDDGAAFHADRRQEDRGSIPGLGPDGEVLTIAGSSVEHDAAIADDWTDPVQNVVDAYIELHYYLQLLTEAFGWDPERSMPFGFVMEKDGRFTPITDPIAMLDIMDVRSKEARKKRQVAQTQVLAAALAARRKLLRNATKKA